MESADRSQGSVKTVQPQLSVQKMFLSLACLVENKADMVTGIEENTKKTLLHQLSVFEAFLKSVFFLT